VEYTKVDLNSPHKEFPARDTSVGLDDGDEDDDVHYDRPGSTAGDRAKLIRDGGADGEDGETTEEAAKKPSVLSMAYYQQFFDVDTNQVGCLAWASASSASFVPRPNRNLVSDDIRHSPDLYGPFWCVHHPGVRHRHSRQSGGLFPNISSRRQLRVGLRFSQGDIRRHGNLSVLVAGALLLLWAVTWWRQVPEKYAYLELLCLYGYSLSIYIPVSVLCVIQLAAVQWALILLAMALSGTVLALSLWPSVSSGERRTAVGLLTAAMLLLHAALAVGFKLYFFHVTSGGGGSASSRRDASLFRQNLGNHSGSRDNSQDPKRLNKKAVVCKCSTPLMFLLYI
uniref:Protein YIPF n=1 Tax=Macrostomum lignano TaxID=282301 RepID=A0A1I8JQV1_9PLAT